MKPGDLVVLKKDTFMVTGVFLGSSVALGGGDIIDLVGLRSFNGKCGSAYGEPIKEYFVPMSFIEPGMLYERQEGPQVDRIDYYGGIGGAYTYLKSTLPNASVADINKIGQANQAKPAKSCPCEACKKAEAQKQAEILSVGLKFSEEDKKRVQQVPSWIESPKMKPEIPAYVDGCTCPSCTSERNKLGRFSSSFPKTPDWKNGASDPLTMADVDNAIKLMGEPSKPMPDSIPFIKWISEK